MITFDSYGNILIFSEDTKKQKKKGFFKKHWKKLLAGGVGALGLGALTYAGIKNKDKIKDFIKGSKKPTESTDSPNNQTQNLPKSEESKIPSMKSTETKPVVSDEDEADTDIKKVLEEAKKAGEESRARTQEALEKMTTEHEKKDDELLAKIIKGSKEGKKDPGLVEKAIAGEPFKVTTNFWGHNKLNKWQKLDDERAALRDLTHGFLPGGEYAHGSGYSRTYIPHEGRWVDADGETHIKGKTQWIDSTGKKQIENIENDSNY